MAWSGEQIPLLCQGSEAGQETRWSPKRSKGYPPWMQGASAAAAGRMGIPRWMLAADWLGDGAVLYGVLDSRSWAATLIPGSVVLVLDLKIASECIQESPASAANAKLCPTFLAFVAQLSLRTHVRQPP